MKRNLINQLIEQLVILHIDSSKSVQQFIEKSNIWKVNNRKKNWKKLTSLYKRRNIWFRLVLSPIYWSHIYSTSLLESTYYWSRIYMGLLWPLTLLKLVNMWFLPTWKSTFPSRDHYEDTWQNLMPPPLELVVVDLFSFGIYVAWTQSFSHIATWKHEKRSNPYIRILPRLKLNGRSTPKSRSREFCISMDPTDNIPTYGPEQNYYLILSYSTLNHLPLLRVQPQPDVTFYLDPYTPTH